MVCGHKLTCFTVDYSEFPLPSHFQTFLYDAAPCCWILVESGELTRRLDTTLLDLLWAAILWDTPPPGKNGDMCRMADPTFEPYGGVAQIASTPGPTEFVGPGSRRHVAWKFCIVGIDAGWRLPG